MLECHVRVWYEHHLRDTITLMYRHRLFGRVQ